MLVGHGQKVIVSRWSILVTFTEFPVANWESIVGRGNPFCGKYRNMPGEVSGTSKALFKVSDEFETWISRTRNRSFSHLTVTFSAYSPICLYEIPSYEFGWPFFTWTEFYCSHVTLQFGCRFYNANNCSVLSCLSVWNNTFHETERCEIWYWNFQ